MERKLRAGAAAVRSCRWGSARARTARHRARQDRFDAEGRQSDDGSCVLRGEVRRQPGPGEPPNSGFGRVAWAMPIVIGVGGFLTVAYLAMRWSRRPRWRRRRPASKIPRWPRALTTSSATSTEPRPPRGPRRRSRHRDARSCSPGSSSCSAACWRDRDRDRRHRAVAAPTSSSSA